MRIRKSYIEEMRDLNTKFSTLDLSNMQFSKEELKMLEHGTVYLKIPYTNHENRNGKVYQTFVKYRFNQYSRIGKNEKDEFGDWELRYITTNYKVLVENEWLDDLQYLCEPTERHEKRTSAKIMCDMELMNYIVYEHIRKFAIVVDRIASCKEEELSFNEPHWFKGVFNTLKFYDGFFDENQPIERKRKEAQHDFVYHMKDIERLCKTCLTNGWTKDMCMKVMPLSLTSNIIMTGYVSDWVWLFENEENEELLKLLKPLQEKLTSGNV